MVTSELEYQAISLDTSVLGRDGLSQDRTLLRLMEQFKGGPFRVVLSEIVVSELRKHLAEDIGNAREKVEAALKAANKTLRVPDTDIAAARALLTGEGTIEECAEERVAGFCSRLGADVVACDGFVDVARLQEMYFSVKPPFETRKGKKAEFPDALALLSLEAYARKHGIRILVASQDGGWKKFAEESDWLDVVGKLSEAIATFQPHLDVHRLVAEVKENLRDYDGMIATELRKALERCVEDSDIVIDMQSDFYCEEDNSSAAYRGHEFQFDGDGTPHINVISADEHSVVLELPVHVDITVEADFSLAVWDSIDKEYEGMGSTSRAVDVAYDTDVLVTFAGDVAGGLDAVKIIDTEVSEMVQHVEMGDLEPSWYGETPAAL